MIEEFAKKHHSSGVRVLIVRLPIQQDKDFQQETSEKEKKGKKRKRNHPSQPDREPSYDGSYCVAKEGGPCGDCKEGETHICRYCGNTDSDHLSRNCSDSNERQRKYPHVETAKTGRAKCKLCGSKIKNGEIKIVMNQGRHFQAQGYHPDCFFKDIGGIPTVLNQMTPKTDADFTDMHTNNSDGETKD